jgi:hypothetical protein
MDDHPIATAAAFLSRTLSSIDPEKYQYPIGSKSKSSLLLPRIKFDITPDKDRRKQHFETYF